MEKELDDMVRNAGAAALFVVMIALTALLSAYASTLAVRARNAAEKPTSDGRH